MKKITVPGDKSITQRFLILGGLADGKSLLRGALSSSDCSATAEVLQKLGVDLSHSRHNEELAVLGCGFQGFKSPDQVLDFRNSGTGARLMLGAIAGQSNMNDIVVTGDESLRKRPMARVVDPLQESGARITYIVNHGMLPISVTGEILQPIVHDSLVASAQVKSSLLLAGLVSGTPVNITEPFKSRDHTERILVAAGIDIQGSLKGGHWEIKLDCPPESLSPFEVTIPGDFSSAAFLIGYAVLGGAGTGLVIENVGLNPTRTGLLEVLMRMGAKIKVSENPSDCSGEPVGTIEVTPTELSGIEIGPQDVPSMIDEFPLMAILGSRATGVTKIRGAKELRFKESDRIRALVDNMRVIGINIEEYEDGFEIWGTEEPLEGKVFSHGDHRIAMAFGALAGLPDNKIDVEGKEVVDVSFPGFWEMLTELEGNSE